MRSLTLKMLTVLGLGLLPLTNQALAGDAEAGEALAGQCVACHGAAGQGQSPAFPKLAGQGAKYTYKQLVDMKEGRREVAMMAGIVAALSDQDMKDLAAYFEEQETKVGEVKADLRELGERIYRAGNTVTGVAACTSCHGVNGLGVATAGFPALSGQYADYTSAQLKAFRAAGRNDAKGPYRDNDNAAMMRAGAARMSDAEIEAVSSYINGLY